jgi:hypothetical protein
VAEQRQLPHARDGDALAGLLGVALLSSRNMHRARPMTAQR